MSKIQFLYKSSATLNLILIFLISKFKDFFVKRKIINLKKNHQNSIKNKKITYDYFSSHAYNFYFYLKNLDPYFEYLEVGSYEGNSAIFIANNFDKANIYCVDSWKKTNEYKHQNNFSDVEKNFDENTFNYKNINKIKMNSNDFFLNNKKKFDVIYIDGYHHASQVYEDCNNAWRNLKENGYLICDDYIWNFYENIRENPCYAINKFLREINGYFKVEKISNSQIFLKKIGS